MSDGYYHGASVGGVTSPTYRSWRGMKSRCLNPKDPFFHRYGGRGIKICDRWIDFRNFVADMGERPDRSQLDRTDNNGNYELGNCKWATASENSSNRRTNHFIEFNGERLTISQWALKIGKSKRTILWRINHKWPTEKVLSTEKYKGERKCQ